MNNFLRNKVIHPFLFAAFPVLFLYAENFNLVSGGQVWAPLVIITLSSFVIFLLSRLLLKSWYKAGLFTSALVLLFFLYRPLFAEIQHKPLLNIFTFTRHREFFVLYILPFLALAIYLFRSQNKFTKFNQVLNITAIVLLAPSLVRLTYYWAQHSEPLPQPISANLKSAKLTPNIYYFILDEYGRHDVLEKTFKYNNRPFINALKKRGFYVAEKSTSNYCKTLLSIPATLNLNYIQNIISDEKLNSRVSFEPKKHIANSSLRQFLKKKRYQYVVFGTGILFTQIDNADHYFSLERDISEFDVAILNLTPIPDIFKSLFFEDVYTAHRETILYPFQHINKAIEVPSPKFVQVHLLSPHVPFAFDINGNSKTEIQVTKGTEQYMKGNVKEWGKLYVEQISFLNKKMLHIVNTIQKNDPSSVIIIQGDHGVRINDLKKNNQSKRLQFKAFSNLSAFYFPDRDTTMLYPEISNVNTFRVVLNKYFDTQLPILQDKNYYTLWSNPYSFTDVTDQVKSSNPTKTNFSSK